MAPFSSNNGAGRQLSPEPRCPWVLVPQQVMRRIGAEMQSIRSQEAGPPTVGVGAGARENFAGWGLWAGWALCCGHGQAQIPSSSQVHGEPVILSTGKARSPSVGRTWPPIGSWFQLVILLFHSSSPSSQLPQEGPVLPLPPAAPARKCHWSLLEENATPPSGCKGGDTDGGSERARDMPDVTQHERQRGLGAWSWD